MLKVLQTFYCIILSVNKPRKVFILKFTVPFFYYNLSIHFVQGGGVLYCSYFITMRVNFLVQLILAYFLTLLERNGCSVLDTKWL
jgi:hypothetical protein